MDRLAKPPGVLTVHSKGMSPDTYTTADGVTQSCLPFGPCGSWRTLRYLEWVNAGLAGKPLRRGDRVPVNPGVLAGLAAAEDPGVLLMQFTLADPFNAEAVVTSVRTDVVVLQLNTAVPQVRTVETGQRHMETTLVMDVANGMPRGIILTATRTKRGQPDSRVRAVVAVEAP